VIIVNPHSDRARQGFTLLELMLALLIASILLTTVYGALTRTISSRDIGEQRAELFAVGRDTVMRMGREIESALTPPSGDRIYFRGMGGSGQIPSLEFVAMNRGGYGLNRVRPGRILIVYTLDPLPKQQGYFALRREEHLFAALLAAADGIEPTPVPDDQQGQDQDQDEPAAPTAVATYLLDCPDTTGEIDLPGNCIRVVNLAFRYYDDALQQWQDQWDSTVEPMLDRIPAAVEIDLTVADERGSTQDFSTIVDLPLSRGQPTPGQGGADANDQSGNNSDNVDVPSDLNNTGSQ
jgi:prepilin-type N-terminal cleavage/methylation domain-containing protein